MPDSKSYDPLCFIGGGQMARAMVQGILAGGRSPTGIRVVDPGDDSQTWWPKHHPEVPLVESADALKQCETVILAVKPHVIASVIEDVGDWSGRLVISIAAGITLETLSAGIGHDRIVRVMPNTPSLVRCGMSAFAVGDGVDEGDIAQVNELLSAIGDCVRVDESAINAVTGLSGSGPAYVCLIIESLADGGVAAGLPRALAMRLATQTVLGTATMIQQSGHHPGQLKDAVASPGGTTIAGLRSLESSRIRSAMIEAVLAATQRADEMS